MTTHTPGRWIGQDTAGGHNTEIYSEESGLAIALTYHWFEDGENQANASLIAAAPELLEACINLCGFLETKGYDGSIVRAAIAKARGK